MVIRTSSFFLIPLIALPICGFTVGGISLALPLLIPTLLFILWLAPVLLIWLFVLLLFLVAKLLSDDTVNTFEWTKSAVLFLLNFGILIGIGYIRDSPRALEVNRDRVLWSHNFLIDFIALHGLFLVVQYVTFNFGDSLILLNPLGPFSPPGPDPLSTDVTPYNPILQYTKRPNGLAWEPSTAAAWQLLGIALLLSHRGRVRFETVKLVLMVAGIICTSSATGYLILAIVLAHEFYFSRSINRHAALLLYPAFIIGVVLAAALMAQLLLELAGLLERTEEFSMVGSSGYLRLIAPMQLIQERGFSIFGQEALGERTYRLEIFFADSTDNSLAGIANTYFETYVYFGILGLLSYVFIIIRLVLQTWDTPAIAVFLICFPFFGGYLFNALAFLPIFLTLTVHFLMQAEVRATTNVRQHRGLLAGDNLR